MQALSLFARATRLVIVLSVASLAVAGTALAALPRTYTSQKIDGPEPQGTIQNRAGDRFGDGLVNGGDVNGDGKDDVLVGIDEHATVKGKVFVFSGANGSLIRSIAPPDPDDGGTGDNPSAFGTYVGKVADLGSCPGFSGTPGQDCAAAQPAMDAGDGVPDHLVSAIGVDVDTPGDDMGTAYLLDGATGAVLKRMRVPAADRAQQALNAPTASQGPGFGRTIISPAGQPPCAGNGGLGPCDAMPEPVREGDLEGSGKPDIVVGASDFSETTATNPACNDGGGNGKCFQAGRFYVFKGEDLAGQAPNLPLEAPHYTIKNPTAQHDDANVNSRFHREAMGYSVAAVGDQGKCNKSPAGSAGSNCLNTDNLTTPDGKPEFIASSHRTDTNGMGDAGVAFSIDGPTGQILDVYNHPQPQVSAVFAFSNYNQPVFGDLGSSLAPDVYQGAMVQDVKYMAQGRGYVMSGDFRSGGANHYSFSVLDDPTPNKIGNFGTSSAGLGNVAGAETSPRLDSRKELMIGAYGPHAPQVIEDVPSDVHVFSPLTDEVLQTIAAPDPQPGSGFGRSLAPLGDLNGDTFLDYAVGAGGYDDTASNQGRLYILRSCDGDTNPACPKPPDPTPPPETRAGRTIEIEMTSSSIRRGQRTKLVGQVDAFANPAQCQSGVPVDLQTRVPGDLRWSTFKRVLASSTGRFKKAFAPGRTRYYRARLPQTDQCLGAVSNREKVTVSR